MRRLLKLSYNPKDHEVKGASVRGAAVRRRLSFDVTATGCFEVTSHRSSVKGYSLLRVNGALTLAHRFIYEECFGEIPHGLCVLHKCDNPKCINPDHLFLGSQLENIRDMVDKGRSPRGEHNHAAKLTTDTVRNIRLRYSPRDPLNGGRALAREYGVCQGVIQRITSGKAWAYIDGERAQQTLGLEGGAGA